MAFRLHLPGWVSELANLEALIQPVVHSLIVFIVWVYIATWRSPSPICRIDFEMAALSNIDKLGSVGWLNRGVGNLTSFKYVTPVGRCCLALATSVAKSDEFHLTPSVQMRSGVCTRSRLTGGEGGDTPAS